MPETRGRGDMRQSGLLRDLIAGDPCRRRIAAHDRVYLVVEHEPRADVDRRSRIAGVVRRDQLDLLASEIARVDLVKCELSSLVRAV